MCYYIIILNILRNSLCAHFVQLEDYRLRNLPIRRLYQANVPMLANKILLR